MIAWACSWWPCLVLAYELSVGDNASSVGDNSSTVVDNSSPVVDNLSPKEKVSLLVMCLMLTLVDSFLISDLNRSSFKDYGIKEALTNLVIESEGMRAVNQQFQNKAKAGVVSGNPKVESAKLNPSEIVKYKKTLDERKNKKVKDNKMLFKGGVQS